MGDYVVSVTGLYEGGFRCRAVHGPSESELFTDAPLDNRGKGERFSPTDLVATAAGTCVCTIIGIKADALGVDVSSMRFETTKQMAAGPRRIGRLVTTVYLPAGIGEDDRRSLEAAAHGCPVHQSLADNVDAPINFVYE